MEEHQEVWGAAHRSGIAATASHNPGNSAFQVTPHFLMLPQIAKSHSFAVTGPYWQARFRLRHQDVPQ